MMNGEIETIPQPAVKNLRSKFEQLAVETSTAQNSIKRPPSSNGNGSLLEPVSPRQRTSSGGSYSHDGPDETRQLRASSSSSDLRKRPPPPPPSRVPKATSPNPSPLLRPVPIPSSTAPAISVGHPRIPSISLVDAGKPAERDNDDTQAAASISSLRSKFSNNDSKGHFSRASESHIAPYPKSYIPYKIRSQPDPPSITSEDPLIELSPRSSSSSLSSPDSELSQHSAPLPKASRRHPPPPRPPPRHRASALPFTPATETPPPLPSRRNTAINPVPVDENPPILPPRLPIRAHVTAPATPTLHSELPCPSPTTDRRVLGASRLLPPPTRTIALGDKLPPARRAAPSDSSDDDSEDEDLKGTGVDMLPDSSQSSRRPPLMHEVHEGYNIYSKITVELYTGHVRMSGTHVVIGHSHKVRLYDLAVQDTPLWVLDSKEVGVKGVTITSLEFRPARERHDKGRYAWVGTKEGHILEVDIKSGQFTGAKLSAHLYGVIHLFRHGRSMISIDEAGKVLVFTPDSEDEDIKLSHTQPRVVRITEKVDFAKLMSGMLWTASRSDKAGAKTPAKTPIIRVYDIFTPGCVGRTVLPTEHVGPVTSAAVLPSDPDRAYVGHEEGYITIWALNTEDRYPKCVEVMKVSMSDILCLEGVNNRLWAGSRSGTISAYDVVQRPWVVTNCWNPHPGMPVMKLQVDPLGLEYTGRLCVLSVSRDELLRLWDGLLSYDWIDQELMKYEQSYSQFRDLTVLLVSWNCDAAKPDSLTGDPANINFLHDVLTSVDSPDIISFGFQEVIDLESRKMAAKNVLLTAATGGKKHEEGKVTGAYRRWFDRLLLACPYTVVHTESLVGLFTCIFVKNTERGGIVARFIIEDSSMCFINCHLGAGQNKVRTRNADITGILEEKTMFPVSPESVSFVGGGDGSAVTDHEMVFINGDMNYRIDQRRDAIVASVRANEWESMLPHDQLLKEIKYNRGCRLRGFSEGPLTFPPTYKYDRRSDEYDSSEKRRSPAWCDRVLWRARVPSRVEQIHYRRYEANVSDHRPVSSAFKMTIKSVRHEIRQKYKSEVQVRWVEEEQKRLAVLRAFYVSKQLV
ncbi:Endonuclease/exonuclease/phosphatase [Armillaria novae-zelandiae]|uniref:Endonuclease/exonuclease/phosphatase n=1 Tax=Armillaria novae-zelandiae TaxID=153914 RepID=A0AA39PTH3_9AGAR|nr:Endonuclease/exonuclease/phosphatase [Armillaria novae-zelandiae]